MNSTNAIEKALMQKVNAECREIVDKFIADLKKLPNKFFDSPALFCENGT